MKAMFSTYHLAMKVPTEFGVGVLRDDHTVARKCYALATKSEGKVVVIVSTIYQIKEIDFPMSELFKGLGDVDLRDDHTEKKIKKKNREAR